jgi:hypothetical protein
MVLNECDDIRLGSDQVDAVYLGEDLIWPLGEYTYEVLTAVLYYSSGNILDAGVAGSYYSSNYAYVQGNVRVKRGGTVVETKYDVILTPTLSNNSDFVVFNDGSICAFNLRDNVTSAVKYAYIQASYRTSEPFSLSSRVEQEINTDTITSSSEWIEGDPEITINEVSGSRYVDLVIGDYTPDQPGRVCPAYGGQASMVYYGAHDMARYSSTPTIQWTTYHHSYTSGYTYDSDPTPTGEVWSPVEMVGQPWSVDDKNSIVLSMPSWLTYDSSQNLLLIASEGTTTVQNGRTGTVTATNGSVSDSTTVTQQYNRQESTSTAYDTYVHIVRSSAFPAAGGTYPVNYHSRKTTTIVYTSGDPSTSASNVQSYIAASPDNYVTVTDAGGNTLTTVTGPSSGNGTAYLNLAANTVGQRTISVYVTPIEAMGEAQSDWRYQDAASFPQGEIYPNIVGASLQMPVGAVRLHWVQTPNTTPTPSYPLIVTFTNLTLHFIYDDDGVERTEQPAGGASTFEATFQSNDSNFYPATGSRFVPLLEGKTGECWFTADSTSGVIATFPHKTFTTPGGGGPTLGD